MPEFSRAFSGLAAKRKLTETELVRSIRFMIAAEFEAIQLYEQLAESTENKIARKVLSDIIGEEKEHVGEFAYLLRILAPGDEKDYCEGIDEAKNYLEPMLGECATHVKDGGCPAACDCDTGEAGSCGGPATSAGCCCGDKE